MQEKETNVSAPPKSLSDKNYGQPQCGITALLALMLGACGQAGPLVLPNITTPGNSQKFNSTINMEQNIKSPPPVIGK